jgi:quinone-modifying oxidoreductase subunit QmoC
MSNLNQAMVEKYRSSFLKEVEANVEEGHWVKMCMQCGVCSGSCPLGPHWVHPPQELFMMIRAGKREEVLTSDSMWMCTSCYNCIARCPRGLPITHIMHGLASYAKKLGLAPKRQPTEEFGQIFWNSIAATGRVNELKIGLALQFKDGIGQGIKNAMAQQALGMAMMKTKRMSPMELFGGHKCKDTSGIAKMLKKAKEVEDQHIAAYGAGS